MRVIGIVAEFNPFHNGHKYLIEEARKEVNDKRAIVMTTISGSFTQRGEPAIMPKHSRARQALKCGSDVVLELPFTFACAPSDRFGRGSIELLYRTGVVTDIAFGIDCSRPELLKDVADLIFENNNSEEFKRAVSEYLAEGMSYPAARSKAVLNIYEKKHPEADDLTEISEILRAPNSILALEYLITIKKLRAPWKIHMIKRIGEAYSSTENSSMASATGIRQAIRGLTSTSEIALTLKDSMPAESLSVLLHEMSFGRYSALDYEGYLNRGLDALRNPHLGEIAYMGGGLDSYLKNVISNMRDSDYTPDGFGSRVATKHFTQPRIYRAITSAMLFQTEEFVKKYNHVPYIRVLGFSKEGRYCLKVMGKGCARVPIIHNDSDYLEYKDEAIEAVSSLDIAADELQATLLSMPRDIGRRTPPVTDIK